MPQLPPILPWDVYNQTLVNNVHPSDWTNPEPAGRYHLVILGGGAAGLVTAAGAAGLGAKVALIERHLLGGDCLNAGCVPSKALLATARVFAQVRDAASYGIDVPPGSRVNFAAVMERMRRLRAALSPVDAAQRYRRLGVDVFFGEGRFSGPDTVEVAGKTLHFHKAVIATGARAASLPIPGLAETGYLTNETVFTLTDLPPRLAIIGAGAVGCELAQAFARFGSQVTLLEALPRLLPAEDADAVSVVERSLRQDGITIVVGCTIMAVEQRGSEKVIRYVVDGQQHEACVDALLLGVGRRPNVDRLNLERVGVAYDHQTGVQVNDWLQTTNPNIYAAGDVCQRRKFTHLADASARIVLQNALFLGWARVSKLLVPWCLYTDPEIAHVGLHEHELRQQHIPFETFTQPLSEVDRALLDGASEGFVKVHVSRKGRILGATVVARQAGDLISEITLAMTGKLSLGTLAWTIHPYPTQAEAIKKVADAYNRTRLTPLVQAALRYWLAWRRGN